MYLHNKSANAVAWTAAWSIEDENKQAYRAELLRSYIQVDNGIILRTIEWAVFKEGDDSLIITVPLSFGFRHRNCKILLDEVIHPGGEPFDLNQTEVKKVGTEFIPVNDDAEKTMAIYTEQLDVHKNPDRVLEIVH